MSVNEHDLFDFFQVFFSSRFCPYFPLFSLFSLFSLFFLFFPIFPQFSYSKGGGGGECCCYMPFFPRILSFFLFFLLKGGVVEGKKYSFFLVLIITPDLDHSINMNFLQAESSGVSPTNSVGDVPDVIMVDGNKTTSPTGDKPRKASIVQQGIKLSQNLEKKKIG